MSHTIHRVYPEVKKLAGEIQQQDIPAALIHLQEFHGKEYIYGVVGPTKRIKIRKTEMMLDPFNRKVKMRLFTDSHPSTWLGDDVEIYSGCGLRREGFLPDYWEKIDLTRRDIRQLKQLHEALTTKCPLCGRKIS